MACIRGREHDNLPDVVIDRSLHFWQPQGRRMSGSRAFGSHSGAANGPDGYDFAEGAEAEEMDPEQLAALKEEVQGRWI